MAVDSENIEITREIRNTFRSLYVTFDFLTNHAEFETNAAMWAANGIYPVYIGTGENRRFSGVRLGKSEVAESGSVCFEAMVHNNETAGLAGFLSGLNWWDSLGEKKSQVSGDVYLIFAGERAAGQKFFDRIMNGEDIITAEDLIRYRYTADGETNRNRLPPEIAKPDESAAESNLRDDYNWLEANVYSKCIATQADEKPSFVIGIHTYSKLAPATFLPYFYPMPKAGTEASQAAFAAVKAYVIDLSALTGAEIVIIENHYLSGRNYLEGFSHSDESGQFITPGTTIRATFECGQHLDMNSPNLAIRAVMGGLLYKFGPELVSDLQLPAEQSLSFCYDTQQLFAPLSPNVELNPTVNRHWLVPELAAGEAFGKEVHFITGNELPAEIKTATSARPPGYEHLSSEVWQALISAAPDQIKNGARLSEGQCFGYVDVMREGQLVGQRLLFAPYSCVCSMFPLNPVWLSNHKEDMALVYQQEPPLVVKLPQSQKTWGGRTKTVLADDEQEVAKR